MARDERKRERESREKSNEIKRERNRKKEKKKVPTREEPASGPIDCVAEGVGLGGGGYKWVEEGASSGGARREGGLDRNRRSGDRNPPAST